MEITKEKYKEILEIQMVPYNENSRWFEETLAKINQALQLQQTCVIKSVCDIIGHNSDIMMAGKCSICGSDEYKN